MRLWQTPSQLRSVEQRKIVNCRGRIRKNRVDRRRLLNVAGAIEKSDIHIVKFKTLQSFPNPDLTSGDRSTMHYFSPVMRRCAIDFQSFLLWKSPFLRQI